MLNLYRSKVSKTPCLHSNGMLLNFGSTSEILFLLSNSKSHIDVVIRSHSPISHWNQIYEEILSKKEDVVVEFLSPAELFENEKTFPLILDHLNPFDGKKLASFTNEEALGIFNGKPGEVKFPLHLLGRS